MDQVTIVITAVVATLMAFLICRKLVCWYWKLNKISDNLDSILVEVKGPTKSLNCRIHPGGKVHRLKK